jgi:hypothetical protein
VAGSHLAESTPETVRSGYLDLVAKPVAVIQPGDTVGYPNTWANRCGNPL